jgi:hypothetical protein
VSYVARGLGPEAVAGLLDLAQKACSEIRSVKLVCEAHNEEDLDEQAQALLSLGTLLIHHITAFEEYLLPHMIKHVEEGRESDEVIVVVDPPEEDSNASIA